jgi:hypothetical protein
MSPSSPSQVTFHPFETADVPDEEDMGVMESLPELRIQAGVHVRGTR